MAFWLRDFYNEKLDELPSDFTAVWRPGLVVEAKDSDAPNGHGRVLRVTATEGFRTGIRWDTPGSIQNGEVLVLQKCTHVDTITGGFCRGGGTDNNDITALVGFTRASTPAGRREIARYTAGTFSNRGQQDYTAFDNETFPASTTVVPGLWHWVRVNFDGTTIRIKTWRFGLDEPGSWQLTDTDSGNELSSGSVGWSCAGGTNHELAIIGVSDNPAQTVPLGGTLAGVVEDESESPMDDVPVYAVGLDGRQRMGAAVTNSSGEWSMVGHGVASAPVNIIVPGQSGGRFPAIHTVTPATP